MPTAATNRELLAAWRNGDEHAASQLFQRFQARLFALVRSRLSRQLARRLDPDDIVLSAYRSFFVAARHGRVQPTETDDLWPILVTLTLRKLARQARRHSAARRSVEHEVREDSAWMQTVISCDPTPDQVALLTDELQQLSVRLNPAEREVLTQTLQGSEPAAIAAALGVHERTIRRSLHRIRQAALQGQDDERPLIETTFPRQVTLDWNPASIPAKSVGTVSYDQLLLQQLVGVGAFSKVYRGLDRQTGDVVAVKFLRRDCWNDGRASLSIIREWETLRRMEHPNLLRVRHWGQTRRGALFLVTDFILGANLESWRQLARPSISEVTKIVEIVARAIAAAHRVGVLHCDLKPSNILRRAADGQLIVCDFGLARWTHDPDDTPRGGTAGFLCPEQISDVFGPATERSDVYGLGGLLYVLLTGQPPMSGRDLPETLANVLSLAPPQPPSKYRADIPPKLESVVLKCLQKEPADRLAAAIDVAAELEMGPGHG